MKLISIELKYYSALVLSCSLFLIHAAPLLGSSSETGKSAQELLDEFLLKAPSENTGVSYYKNCSELSQDLEQSFSEKWLQNKAWISALIASDRAPIYFKAWENSVASAASVAAGVNGETNVQESGVDESDRFKIGESQIYALSSDSYLQVVDRGDFKYLGNIYLGNLHKTQLLSTKDRLIVLGIENQDMDNESSTIKVYSIRSGALPELQDIQKFEGSILNSRLVDQQLLLVLKNKVPERIVPVSTQEFASEPWFKDPAKKQKLLDFSTDLRKPVLADLVAGKMAGLACNHYVRRNIHDWDFGLTQLYSLDIQSSQVIQQRSAALGYLGTSDEIYVTSHNFYLMKSHSLWFQQAWWGGSLRPQRLEAEKVNVQKINFGRGFLRAEASGQVPGRIKDRWSIKEFQDGAYLVLATTTGHVGSLGEEQAKNHLFVLSSDKNRSLTKVASVEDFAPKEDIRSVRFFGDFAYIVTFEKTDPLFAFDLSDPIHPKLRTELKIPGFSTYMHPLSANLLLGVGFDAQDMGDYSLFQGVKVSLFGIDSPDSIRELQDPLIFGKRGSSSELTGDSKAFYYDPKLGQLGIPLVALELNENGENRRAFSGAVLLSLHEQKLREEARVSHFEWIPKSCQAQLDNWRWWEDANPSLDINRIYGLGDKILTLSRWGLKIYESQALESVFLSLQFPVDQATCSPNY